MKQILKINQIIRYDENLCIVLKNKTGEKTRKGLLVKFGKNKKSFKNIKSKKDTAIGVIRDGGIPNGKKALIVISGMAEILLNDNISSIKGHYVLTGKNGYGNVLPDAIHFQKVGYCLENVFASCEIGNVLAKCLMHFN